MPLRRWMQITSQKVELKPLGRDWKRDSGVSSVTWRCEVCDADLTEFYKQGQKKGVECPNCHRNVDLVKRMYRTRDFDVDGIPFTAKIYRRTMTVGKGHHLEGIVEFKGETILQDTFSDENEEKLISLLKNAIRMRMKSKGPVYSRDAPSP